MPRNAALSLLVSALALAPCACGPRPSARDLVLVTIDTARADHVLAERAGQPLTPHLADLARRAVRFTRASSAGACTSVGTAAVLTGLHPHRAAVTSNAHMLPEAVPTLAAALRDAGFATAGFVANPVLREGMGFGRGFGTYRWIRPRDAGPKTRAAPVTEAALSWLDGRSDDERVFLWVHYMEPHGPYLPPEDLRARLPREAFGAPRTAPLLANNSGDGGIPSYQHEPFGDDTRDVRDYLARYAAEMMAIDRELETLLRGLDARGRLRGALLVVTSDHGEALDDDHGFYFAHGTGVTEDQLHVPLLVACPGCGAGRLREDPVSTADVAPTALHVLGVAPPAEPLDGRSLFDEGPRDVVSQHQDLVALRRGDWKLTRRGNGRLALAHLSGNGPERAGAAPPPEVLADLSRRLDAILARPPLAEPRVRELWLTEPIRDWLEQRRSD